MKSVLRPRPHPNGGGQSRGPSAGRQCRVRQSGCARWRAQARRWNGLRRYYGRIAPRNLGTSPGYTKLDLRVQQAAAHPLGAKVRVFADVENVLNLINRNWNTYKVFNDAVSIANVSCVAQGSNRCARYFYSNPNDQIATTFQNASLWQVRPGARIDF